MSKSVQLSLIIFMMGCVDVAHAQTLHVISATNTIEQPLGDRAVVNSRLVKSFSEVLKAVTGLNLDYKEIQDAEYSCKAIRDAVANLSAGQNDVIIFWHSGHGTSPEGSGGTYATSQFPSFMCEGLAMPLTKENVANLPNLEEVSEHLKAKGARLTITVADSCNQKAELAGKSPAVAARGVEIDKMKLMFLNYEGSAVLSGSIKGTPSWYGPAGGFFTNKLIEVLQHPEGTSEDVLWKTSLDTAKSQTQKTATAEGLQQTPEIDNHIAFKR